MQPNSERVTELKTNGTGLPPVDGTGLPADIETELHVNGSANGELHNLLAALQAMRVGDFSARMPSSQAPLLAKIADTFNEIVAANQRMAQQLERVGLVVGKEGKTRQRVSVGMAHGAWGEMESSINNLIDDLLWPTTEVTRA